MNIVGPDSLIFGVEDLDVCSRYLADYGLIKVESSASGAIYEGLDGTSMEFRKATDRGLASPIAASPNIREVVYGVADKAALQAVAAELTKDRPVIQVTPDRIRSFDDDGYPLGFQVTIRRPITKPYIGINVPGQPPGRGMNVVAAIDDDRPQAYSLSHVVLFTKDKVKAERFYADRLGFRTVDVFTNLGPFMRPAGTSEHHTLFLIETGFVGIQHFTFHFADLYQMMKAAWEFQQKGYKSFWGPGRHILGSNNFWYFNSPFGGIMEFDSDMDIHDDSWVARHVPATADTSQTFLLKGTDKWAPGGDH